MPTIFIEPDATKYSDNLQSTKSPGLEELTGADMVISFLSPNPLTGQVISPVDSVESHIAGRSLFVQIKIGYDIVPTDDRLKSSIARMMKCRIPKGQAILLPVGDYYENKTTGLLQIRGKKPYHDTPFSTLATIFDMWCMRGGSVHCDPTTPKDISQLQDWIDQKYKSMEKIEREGTREIYPPSPVFEPDVFEPDDIWQSVKEIDSGWPRFLVSGLPNCGSATVNSIFKYAKEKTNQNPNSAHHIFCLMTDEDNRGNPRHKIPLWGKMGRKKFREILGLQDGRNLPELDYELVYFQGWRSCLDQFEYMANQKKTINLQELSKIFEELRKENQIPF